MSDRPLDRNAVVIGKGAAVPAKTILRGVANTVLTQTVVNDEPAFTKVNLGTMVTGAIDLATQVTGVLPVANGGNGQVLGAIALLQFEGVAVASGSTVFLGLHADAVESAVLSRMAVGGVILRMNTASSVVANVGESFVYTVRVSAADTAITHTLTGLQAQGSSDGTVSVARGDRVSVKLVTSAAAGVGNHKVMLAVRVDA